MFINKCVFDFHNNFRTSLIWSSFFYWDFLCFCVLRYFSYQYSSKYVKQLIWEDSKKEKKKGIVHYFFKFRSTIASIQFFWVNGNTAYKYYFGLVQCIYRKNISLKRVMFSIIYKKKIRNCVTLTKKIHQYTDRL